MGTNQTENVPKEENFEKNIRSGKPHIIIFHWLFSCVSPQFFFLNYNFAQLE